MTILEAGVPVRRFKNRVANDSFTRANSTTDLGRTEDGKLWVPQTGFTGVNGLQLPGNTGQYASTPDTAALSITGDIDVRFFGAIDWSNAASVHFVNKWTSVTSGYLLYIDSGLKLHLAWVETGAVGRDVACTANIPFADFVFGGVKATLDVNDGAGNRVIKFWTTTVVNPAPGDWAQLGATVTTAGTTAIIDGAQALTIGASNAGTGNLVIGKVDRVQIRNNILDDGTGIVFDADFTKQADAAAATLIEDSTNAATVTMNGVAWGITSNQAYHSIAQGQQIAVVETGLSDVSIKVTLATAGSASGIAFRVVDDLNYLVYVFANPGGTATFYQRVGGVFTLIANLAATATGDVNEVVCKGNYIELRQSGVLRYQGRNDNFLSATKHGIRAHLETTTRLDDFTVTAA